jgi:hypothetical protein
MNFTTEILECVKAHEEFVKAKERLKRARKTLSKKVNRQFSEDNYPIEPKIPTRRYRK